VPLPLPPTVVAAGVAAAALLGVSIGAVSTALTAGGPPSVVPVEVLVSPSPPADGEPLPPAADLAEGDVVPTTVTVLPAPRTEQRRTRTQPAEPSPVETTAPADDVAPPTEVADEPPATDRSPAPPPASTPTATSTSTEPEPNPAPERGRSAEAKQKKKDREG
jgi:hypothetical protein